MITAARARREQAARQRRRMLFYTQGNCPDKGRPFLRDMEADAKAKAKPEAKLRLLSAGRAASRLGDPTDRGNGEPRGASFESS